MTSVIISVTKTGCSPMPPILRLLFEYDKKKRIYSKKKDGNFQSSFHGIMNARSWTKSEHREHTSTHTKTHLDVTINISVDLVADGTKQAVSIGLDVHHRKPFPTHRLSEGRVGRTDAVLAGAGTTATWTYVS